MQTYEIDQRDVVERLDRIIELLERRERDGQYTCPYCGKPEQRCNCLPNHELRFDDDT